MQKSLDRFCTATKDWKSPRIGLLGLANEQIQGFLIHPQNVSELIILHTYIKDLHLQTNFALLSFQAGLTSTTLN